MAEEARRVVGPIQVEDQSAARVAFEVARHIESIEPDRQDEFLELFVRCVLAIQRPNVGINGHKKIATTGTL